MTQHTDEYLKARAEVIATTFARKNLARKAKVIRDGISPIEGDHTPISYRQDGDHIVVVLKSGPKLIEPVKGQTLVERVIDAVSTTIEEQRATDERQRLLDEREADLLRRENELNEKAAQLQAQQATIIDPADGIDDQEATTAEQAIQAKKAQKK